MRDFNGRKAYVLLDPDGHVVEWAGVRFRMIDFKGDCLDGLLGSNEYDPTNKEAGWRLVMKRGYHVERVIISKPGMRRP